MRFNRFRNVSFLLLTVLLVGTNAEERARIPADVAVDPNKAKSESNRLAKLAIDDEVKFIGHFKQKEAELDVMCNTAAVTPAQCKEGKELLASRVENTRRVVATHKTLSLIFAFYHRLILMNLDAVDELKARFFIDSMCAKTLGLPDQSGLGDRMDQLAEISRKFSRFSKGKVPPVMGSTEFCQSELTALEDFLKRGKKGNSELTHFFSTINIPLEVAKETLKRAKEVAEETETTLRYQDAVRKGAA